LHANAFIKLNQENERECVIEKVVGNFDGDLSPERTHIMYVHRAHSWGVFSFKFAKQAHTSKLAYKLISCVDMAYDNKTFNEHCVHTAELVRANAQFFFIQCHVKFFLKFKIIRT
jgi:hypothetical protein